MKRYALNGLKEITAVETTSGNYYLASDVDARDKHIREETRERVRLLIVQWHDKTAPRREIGELTDRILAEVFKEIDDESK